MWSCMSKFVLYWVVVLELSVNLKLSVLQSRSTAWWPYSSYWLQLTYYSTIGSVVYTNLGNYNHKRNNSKCKNPEDWKHFVSVIQLGDNRKSSRNLLWRNATLYSYIYPRAWRRRVACVDRCLFITIFPRGLITMEPNAETKPCVYRICFGQCRIQRQQVCIYGYVKYSK